MTALAMSHSAFLDAASRLVRRGHIFSPRRGFYVIVPTRFLKWKAPPPNWYLDALMKWAGRTYYVGLLKAAEFHGAAHQAVMEYQVVLDRQWKPIRSGRSRIAFYYRRDLDAVETGVEPRKTESGMMRISSRDLTALDLIRYPKASGGLDHAATVLRELGPDLDPQRLTDLAPAFERSIIQRLGHILSEFGFDEPSAALHQHLATGPMPWVELDPAINTDFIFGDAPVKDPRWRVIVRRPLQVDEQ